MKRKNREDKNKILGNATEKSFHNHFSKNHQVIASVDEYKEYDFLVDGLKTQVKGLTPFYKFDCWAIKEGVTGKNLESINKCDKFYILSLPGKIPSEYDGYWLEVDKSKCEVKVLEGDFNKDKKRSFVIPRNANCVKKVCKISEQEEKDIMVHGTSSFRKKY